MIKKLLKLALVAGFVLPVLSPAVAHAQFEPLNRPCDEIPESERAESEFCAEA